MVEELPTPPRIVVVGLHRYRVIPDVDGLVGDHAEHRGSTDAEHLTIAYDARLPLSLSQETVLHELLHACWDQTPLRKLDGIECHEEAVVGSLTPVILRMLRENPGVIGYLTTGLAPTEGRL